MVFSHFLFCSLFLFSFFFLTGEYAKTLTELTEITPSSLGTHLTFVRIFQYIISQFFVRDVRGKYIHTPTHKQTNKQKNVRKLKETDIAQDLFEIPKKNDFDY